MKKKLITFVIVAVMAVTMITPALAASSSFKLSGHSGNASLIKNNASVIGKTTYAKGWSVTAVRTVSVTLTCTRSGKTYTYSDKNTATTNAGNYSDTTASITVYRPSSSYTVKSAVSTHSVTMWAESWKKKLSV